MKHTVFPCWYCGAPDSRDRRHQRGCPTLPKPTMQELLECAHAVEEGWRELIEEGKANDVRTNL